MHTDKDRTSCVYRPRFERLRIKRTQRHSRGGPWTVPVVNVVSRGVDAPPGLRGVGDLCRLGDQMLNIPPRQLRTGARHMKQNIIRRAIP